MIQAKESFFGFSTDVKESITDVGEKAVDNCDKIKEYTKIIGCPAGMCRWCRTSSGLFFFLQAS